MCSFRKQQYIRYYTDMLIVVNKCSTTVTITTTFAVTTTPNNSVTTTTTTDTGYSYKYRQSLTICHWPEDIVFMFSRFYMWFVWTNADPIHWRIYATLGEYGLMRQYSAKTLRLTYVPKLFWAMCRCSKNNMLSTKFQSPFHSDKTHWIWYLVHIIHKRERPIVG